MTHYKFGDVVECNGMRYIVGNYNKKFDRYLLLSSTAVRIYARTNEIKPAIHPDAERLNWMITALQEKGAREIKQILKRITKSGFDGNVVDEIKANWDNN